MRAATAAALSRADKFETTAEQLLLTDIVGLVPARDAPVLQKEQLMVRKIIAMALVAGGLMVSACNTVEGAGKDISSAGNAVEKAAD